MVTGVAQVNVFGAQKFAVRVDLDPTQLARAADRHRPGRARRSAARNVNRPTGTLYGPNRNFVVQTDGQLMNAEAVPADRRRLPQRQPGPPRRSRATSTTASRTTRRRAGTTARRTIYLAIQRQPGTNTVEVVDAIKALLPQLQAQLPASLSARRSAATGRMSIRESVHDVKFTLLLTVVPRRAGHLPVPAEPLGDDHPQPRAAGLDRRHVRGRCSLLGYSLDNLSLMALTLSVGFVVDDAIVMLENIVRHMEMGKPRDGGGARRARRKSPSRSSR